jgi:thiamine-monophosphate kinase
MLSAERVCNKAKHSAALIITEKILSMPCESELIQRYFLTKPQRADVIVGIGDDGAVIRPPPQQDLVTSVDTLNEGVHFSSRTDPAAIGHKALAVNLSDLAAMGAEPAWATLALTLPAPNEAWLEGFSQGLLRLADQFKVNLVGGDLTRGPLTITLQVIGLVPHGMAICRSGARAGELIFVTGTVGDAGLGLAATQNARELAPRNLDYCLFRLDKPAPRITAGLALRDVASAAIDISDGLSTDLGRILDASGVGASIELAGIPLSAAARAVFDNEVDWNLVLNAGDDYELLFTVPAAGVDALKRQLVWLDCPVSHIGYIEQRAGLRYTKQGVTHALDVSTGYDHFAAS